MLIIATSWYTEISRQYIGVQIIIIAMADLLIHETKWFWTADLNAWTKNSSGGWADGHDSLVGLSVDFSPFW